MSVIGFNIKSINAYLDEKNMKGNVSVNSTPTIESIERRDLSGIGIPDAIAIDFKFVTSYDPKAGEITMTGEILYQVKDAKKSVKQWNDDGKVDDEIMLDVLNTIFRRCLAKAVDLADLLRLPPPLRFPTVTLENPSAKS